MTKKAQKQKAKPAVAKSEAVKTKAAKGASARKKTTTKKTKAGVSTKRISKPVRKMTRAAQSTGTTYQTMETIMTKGQTQFEQIAQDANDFSREGFEAFQKSLSILAKGSEEFFKTAMSIAQTSAEKQQQYMKDAMGSKTLNEWAETQNKIAQASFDDFMAGATKLSELSVKVLTDSSQPINEQATKAMNKTTKAA